MRFRLENEHIVQTILKICALSDWSKKHKCFNKVYKLSFYIAMVASIIAMILKVWLIQTNVIAVLNYLTIAAMSLISQLRFRRQIKNIRVLLVAVHKQNVEAREVELSLGTMHTFHLSASRVERNISSYYTRATYNLNTLLTTLVYTGIGGLVVNILMPILYKCFDGKSDDFSHVFPYFLPYVFEYEHYFCVYLLLLMFEATVTIFVASLYINSILLFIYFTAHLMVQYDILKMRMRRLFPLDHGVRSPVLVQMAFVTCVQKHEELIGFFHTLNSVFTWFMFDVAVFCTGFFSLVLAHMTQMLEMENGLMVLPKVISNVVCYFLVLFCYSYYGTRVMNLNCELSHSLYETPWYNHLTDPRYKELFKFMNFFTMRCLKPLTLKAADTYVFSLAIVSEVFRVSYSLFNCILIRGQKQKSNTM